MSPTERAESVFDEAKRTGLVNHATGDGAPSISMVIDAIHDAEADGIMQGAGDEHQDWLREKKNIESQLARALDDAERAKGELAKDSWTSEMQRALGFILPEFVGNDAWENGVKRMATRLQSLRLVLIHIRLEAEGHGERNGVSGKVRLPLGYQRILEMCDTAEMLAASRPGASGGGTVG